MNKKKPKKRKINRIKTDKETTCKNIKEKIQAVRKINLFGLSAFADFEMMPFFSFRILR